MLSAASKTYISRRMLDRYSQERTKQQEQQSSGNSAPVVPSKTFAEDSNLAPIEEEKKELEETNANLQVEQAQPEAQAQAQASNSEP